MTDDSNGSGGVIGQTVPELLQGLSALGASDAEVTLLLRGGSSAAGAVAHADSEVVWLREEGMSLLAVRAAEILAVRVSAARMPAGRVAASPSKAVRGDAVTLQEEEPPAPPRRRKRRYARDTLTPAEDATQVMALTPAVEPPPAPSLDPAMVESQWQVDLGRSLSLVLEVSPRSDEEAASLHNVMAHLGPAVSSVRRSLLGVVERVIVAATEEPGAERVEGDLWIGVNLSAGRRGRWSSARSMGAAIEAALQS